VRKWKEFANLFNILFYRENNTFFHFYRKINAFSLALTEGANSRLERKREEIRRLESSYEEELKALARKRGELNLVEGLIKRRRREEEKRKEVLNERFIYQVLYSSSPN
jgi:molecular chaperone GrpE (heat shock protein)